MDPGTYELDQPEGEDCLSIRGAHGLTVEGGTGAGGKPATRLVRRHTLNTSGRQFPAILSVRESDWFTLRNVIFDNSPQITSAGYVMEKQGTRSRSTFWKVFPSWKASDRIARTFGIPRRALCGKSRASPTGVMWMCTRCDGGKCPVETAAG